MSISSDYEDNLTFNTHIDFITNNANRTFGFLRRNLHNCKLDIKHIAYNTLVCPTLEYYMAIWDPYTKHNIKKHTDLQSYTRSQTTL